MRLSGARHVTPLPLNPAFQASHGIMGDWHCRVGCGADVI
jgi:hypothetical protein